MNKGDKVIIFKDYKGIYLGEIEKKTQSIYGNYLYETVHLVEVPKEDAKWWHRKKTLEIEVRDIDDIKLDLKENRESKLKYLLK